MSIAIAEGSILDFKGDAIVNPANGFLMHGAGLARVIDRAARNAWTPQGVVNMSVADIKARVAEDVEKIRAYVSDHQRTPTIATGNVAVTSAGVLPYKGIIHAVGPVWNGGRFCEAALLASAHAEAVAAAHARSWESVAFPAISCGLFGYPVERAAKIAVEAVLFASLFDVDVTFYPFGFEAEYTRALQEVTA